MIEINKIEELEKYKNYDNKTIEFDTEETIKINFDLHLKTGWSIKAGGLIKAGGYIEARGYIEAGGPIKAGGYIEAGWFIKAGGFIEAIGPIKAGGYIEARGYIEAGGYIEAREPIKAGGYIKAGGFIEAIGPIKAGEYIKAGGYIEARRYIEAGGYIEAEGLIEAREYIYSFVFEIKAEKIITGLLPFWRKYWSALPPLKKWKKEIENEKNCWSSLKNLLTEEEKIEICNWEGWHWILKGHLECFFELKTSFEPPETEEEK